MAYKHDSKLNDGESLSIKELAKEFNTSDRTKLNIKE